MLEPFFKNFLSALLVEISRYKVFHGALRVLPTSVRMSNVEDVDVTLKRPKEAEGTVPPGAICVQMAEGSFTSFTHSPKREFPTTFNSSSSRRCLSAEVAEICKSL